MDKDRLQKTHQRLPLWTAGGALQLVASLLWLPQAWLLALAIDAMVSSNQVWNKAIFCAIGMVCLGVIRTLADAAGARLSFRQARTYVSHLRQKALQALAMRSPLDTGRLASGETASVLAEQAEAIVPYLARYQPVMLKVSIVPLVFVGSVFCCSWVAALILLCTAPLIPIFMILVGWRAKAASEKQMLEMGNMNAFLLDRLRGLATIRAFDAVDIVAKRLRDAANTVRDKTMSVLRIAFLSSAVLELFSAIGVAMVACYIGFHMLGNLSFGAWGTRMSLFDGMFILLLAPTFFDPLKELSAVWHDRASGVAAMNSMQKVGKQGVEMIMQLSSVKGAQKAYFEQEYVVKNPGALGVEFRDVAFSYPGTANFVLQHFDMQINPGQKVALVAPSGSGKSTLLSLMAGLLPVTSGEIRIGGASLDNTTIDTLRTRMGWISQQPHIFAGTLLDNIRLGREHLTQSDLQRAIEAAALTSVVQGRLHHHLGEGGVGLSGGEVLRLALARALVEPDLGLLLADEPTAHLDAQTAQEVFNGLLAVAAQGVTLVIATHDEHILPLMDQVIRLEQVVMEGQADA